MRETRHCVLLQVMSWRSRDSSLLHDPAFTASPRNVWCRTKQVEGKTSLTTVAQSCFEVSAFQQLPHGQLRHNIFSNRNKNIQKHVILLTTNITYWNNGLFCCLFLLSNTFSRSIVFYCIMSVDYFKGTLLTYRLIMFLNQWELWIYICYTTQV
jgi:hypothetical protein